MNKNIPRRSGRDFVRNPAVRRSAMQEFTMKSRKDMKERQSETGCDRLGVPSPAGFTGLKARFLLAGLVFMLFLSFMVNLFSESLFIANQT
jgi:hypothetical protein